MTFDQALQATPLVAQIFFMGVGLLVGCLPALVIWSKMEEWEARVRSSERIRQIREEYIKELQDLSKRERDQFHKFTMDLLTEEPPKPTHKDLN
jgi:hypothetical protein